MKSRTHRTFRHNLAAHADRKRVRGTARARTGRRIAVRQRLAKRLARGPLPLGYLDRLFEEARRVRDRSEPTDTA